MSNSYVELSSHYQILVVDLQNQDIILMELITLQCQKQTHKRQKILTRQFSFDQEGASMCSLLLSKHASTKWLTVAPPHIPDAVVPAPHLGFV
jgi:hypothetical protein